MTAVTATDRGSGPEPAIDALHGAAVAIGGATAVSGLALIVAPSMRKTRLGAGRAEPTPFLFRIIGMFMAVSGGLLADGARARSGGRERGEADVPALLGQVGSVLAELLHRPVPVPPVRVDVMQDEQVL